MSQNADVPYVLEEDDDDAATVVSVDDDDNDAATAVADRSSFLSALKRSMIFFGVRMTRCFF